MNTNNKLNTGITSIYVGVIIGILILGSIIWIFRPGPESVSPPASSGQLTAEENDFDFGTISMAAGKVSHSFRVKNMSSEPIMINKMYTSCMCTTASMMTGDKQFGPYGMPGHGVIPKINQTINPGEEISVEVKFDPAAHGPAGVGRIQRAVILENNSQQPLELRFSAMVTP